MAENKRKRLNLKATFKTIVNYFLPIYASF